MDELEGKGRDYTTAIGIHAEKDFWKKVADGVEKEQCGGKGKDVEHGIAAKRLVDLVNDQADGTERGEGIGDENGPEEVFGIVQVTHQDFGAATAFASLLANAPAAQ